MMNTDNCFLQFRWKLFSNLSLTELYSLLQIRQQVFIVEQNCVYADADNLDQCSWHLLASDDNVQDQLVGYLRVLPPHSKSSEAAIGRVLTAPTHRGRGIGRKIIQHALHHIEQIYPGTGIRISAQHYLEHFYQQLGFRTISPIYEEDGIPHIEMLYLPQS